MICWDVVCGEVAANAYGLNSGAMGQAALAQGNRLQEDLMSLARAHTAALTEIQRQRTTLSVQFQSAINQAIAENDPELAMTLLRQCKNAEKELNEQEAYYTNGLTRFQKLWDKIGGVLDAQ